MDNPQVRVREVPVIDGQITEGGGVDLGGSHSLEAAVAEEAVNRVLGGLKAKAKHVFELQWKGNKIPRGAIILGKEIAWTQNGIVTSVEGEMIGTYERLEEFGGTDQKDQKMRVYVTEEGGGHEGN